MIFPEDLRYTTEHEWIKIENNIGTVGITDFAQTELGDIVYIETEPVGSIIEKGEVFGTLDAVKTVTELIMPISGKIIKINPILEAKAEIINQSPYEQGWIIVIEISKLEKLETLLTYEDYKSHIGSI